MKIDRALLSGGLSLLLLQLLEEEDMYGYQMIAILESRSDKTFALKAGTLYPLLHNLEKQGAIAAYEKVADTGRARKYYRITPKGKGLLQDKKREWALFHSAVNKVLEGGRFCAKQAAY